MMVVCLEIGVVKHGAHIGGRREMRTLDLEASDGSEERCACDLPCLTRGEQVAKLAIGSSTNMAL
jgi:hypothetical protein